MAKVADMELDELKQWIETVVEQKLLELLGDPDEGLTLRPEIAERIQRTLSEIQQGRRFTPRRGGCQGVGT